jgi:serine/threonine protein kinase
MRVDPRLRTGQVLAGKKTAYVTSEKLHPAIWRATCPHHPEGPTRSVIVKWAPEGRLKKECDILKRFRDVPSIRQLVDEIQIPPLMVLENLDRNLLDESGAKRLKRSDIKYVAKHILEALVVIHENNIVHAGRMNATTLDSTGLLTCPCLGGQT